MFSEDFKLMHPKAQPEERTQLKKSHPSSKARAACRLTSQAEAMAVQVGRKVRVFICSHREECV